MTEYVTAQLTLWGIAPKDKIDALIALVGNSNIGDSIDCASPYDYDTGENA
jgi:hypothetical protein